MKKIGIIGGMSMESTIHYCEKINNLFNSKVVGATSVELVLITVDFAKIVELQNSGNWIEAGRILNEVAIKLEKAGVDFIIMATNTMHKVVDSILVGINIPLLHIAETTLRELKRDNITKVGLLGTRFTMEDDFYKKILQEEGVEVVIPSSQDIKELDRIIFKELCNAQIKEKSKEYYSVVMKKLRKEGVQAIIYGCTEIEMFGKEISPVTVYNTTEIHVKYAVEMALS